MRPGALGQRCCTFLWLGNLRLTEARAVSASAGAQAFSLVGAAQAFPRQRPRLCFGRVHSSIGMFVDEVPSPT